MVVPLKEDPLFPSVQNASVNLLMVIWQLPTLRYPKYTQHGAGCLSPCHVVKLHPVAS